MRAEERRTESLLNICGAAANYHESERRLVLRALRSHAALLERKIGNP
jgi:hypothetical protein